MKLLNNLLSRLEGGDTSFQKKVWLMGGKLQVLIGHILSNISKIGKWGGRGSIWNDSGSLDCFTSMTDAVSNWASIYPVTYLWVIHLISKSSKCGSSGLIYAIQCIHQKPYENHQSNRMKRDIKQDEIYEFNESFEHGIQITKYPRDSNWILTSKI